MGHIGELAALSTALLWSFTAIFFSEAGRRIGSFRVNKIRLIFAVLIYGAITLVTTGWFFPQGLNTEQIFWLSISGLIGLVLGDGCGFKALVMIGPRLTTLVLSTAPIVATIIAWIFLGERLGWLDLAGIVVTLAGVSWVVLERRYNNGNQFGLKSDHPDSGTLAKGILLAIGASIGQAVGLVLSKQGMLFSGGAIDPLQASFVRMLAATAIIWIYAVIRREVKETVKTSTNAKAMGLTAAGAVFGPFLGVWMSLVALNYISAGIAATLNATTPILILPTVLIVYKEKMSPRAIIGAVLAVAGVAMIFLA